MVISCKVRKLSPIRGLSWDPTHESGQNLFTVPAPDDQNLHLSVSIQSLFAFKKYPVIWNIAHSSIKLLAHTLVEIEHSHTTSKYAVPPAF